MSIQFFADLKTKEKRYGLIDAFNSTSRYLDDLLNIDNIHFEHMVYRITGTSRVLHNTIPLPLYSLLERAWDMPYIIKLDWSLCTEYIPLNFN